MSDIELRRPHGPDPPLRGGGRAARQSEPLVAAEGLWDAEGLTQRIGAKKAKVALARKPAVILW